MKNPDISKDELIIRSAIKVFAQHGYFKSRISDIVKEANIAHGLFYHYFPSKEDILVIIFQNAWNNLLKYIDRINTRKNDPYDKLRAILEFILRSFRQDPDLMKVLIMDVPRIDKFYNKSNQRLYYRLFQGVDDIIVEGQEKGLMKKGVSASVASYIFNGSLDAIIRQYVYNPEFDQTKISIKDIIDKIMEILTDGLSAKNN